MISYSDFARRAASAPGHCVLLARHGERPPIDPHDPTFGAELPLTEAGRAQALACGRSLRPAGTPADWTFLASALRRTRLTAATVAEGIGADPASVAVSPEMSIPGLYVADPAAVARLQEAEGAAAYCDRLLRDGAAEGMRPVADIAGATLAWLRSARFPTRFVFASTHDIFLACLLSGLRLAPVSAALWVDYLQGVAFLERPDGSFDADFCVPDDSPGRRPFVP